MITSALNFNSRGLTNLVELDLSFNALTSVPVFGRADCRYLMRLSLRGNRIKEIGDSTFRDVAELNSLDVSDCGIEAIAAKAFAGLKNLEYLQLENNRLTTLSPSISFPSKLRYAYVFPVCRSGISTGRD